MTTSSSTSMAEDNRFGDRFTWPILKSKKNYLVWRQKIMAICRERNLTEVLLNDHSQDPSKTKPNEKCFSVILLSLNEDTGIHATEFEETPNKCHQLWKKLQGIYGDKDPQTSAMILQNLSCIKKKPNQPLEQHLKRFDELISQHTSSTNKAIEPMYKNTFLLTSLSDCPEYKQTITSLMTTTTELNYETIIQKLKVTEEQLSRERKDNKNQAFMISQNDQRETRQCYKCLKYGHIAINCRSKHMSNQQGGSRGATHYNRGRGATSRRGAISTSRGHPTTRGGARGRERARAAPSHYNDPEEQIFYSPLTSKDNL